MHGNDKSQIQHRIVVTSGNEKGELRLARDPWQSSGVSIRLYYLLN